jgi:murein DD-endopeptidase MepM/ murein hydrolase activator NlpD
MDRAGKGMQGLGNALMATGVGAKAGIALQVGGGLATGAGDAAKARAQQGGTKPGDAPGDATGDGGLGAGAAPAAKPSKPGKPGRAGAAEKGQEPGSAGPDAKTSPKANGKTGVKSGGKGLKDRAMGAAGRALDRADVTDKAIKAGADNMLGEDSAAGRAAQQAYRTGLKVLGRINPKLALAIKVVPAVVLLVLFLLVTAIIAVVVGLSAPSAPEAAEDTEALEETEIGDDHLRAYKEAALAHGVPWPILAAIGEVASKHGTVNPYTVADMNGALPVPGPDRIEPGDDGVGGTGPLLLSDEALEHPLQTGSPHNYYDALNSVAAILADWVTRYVDGEIPDIDETVRVGAGGAGTSGDVAFGGAPGSMIIPTEGRVSSEFGYRIHPISGARRLHAGMDIAAPGGTPIHAGAAGAVTFVGWRGGYGNTVIVDHGGGISTLYAHQSRTGTSVGSQVRQGEVIGFVGTTGYSTGNHLHWEVHVNGDPQNPRNFLEGGSQQGTVATASFDGAGRPTGATGASSITLASTDGGGGAGGAGGADGGGEGFDDDDEGLTLGPDDVTEMLLIGNYDEQVLTTDNEFWQHVELYRRALEQTNVIEFTANQVCLLPRDGFTIPQHIETELRCQSATSPPRTMDPVRDVEMTANDSALTLITELVDGAFLYNGFGSESECDPDSRAGGIFPIAPGPPVLTIDTSDPPDGIPDAWDGTTREWYRCDNVTNIREAITDFLEVESVRPVSRPGNRNERAAGGWMGLPGALGVPSRNTFLAEGPPQVNGTWDADTNECLVAVESFRSVLYSTPDVVPAGWGFYAPAGSVQEALASTAGVGTATVEQLTGLLDELRAVPSWAEVEAECDAPDVMGNARFNQEYAQFVDRTMRAAGSSTLIDNLPDPAKGFMTMLSASALAGTQRADWGAYGAVPRLTNPRAVILDPPEWQPISVAPATDQIISFSLTFIGREGGVVGSGGSIQGLLAAGVPEPAARAYVALWERRQQFIPTCMPIRLALVAAIGGKESNHGRHGGGVMDPVTGDVSPEIFGSPTRYGRAMGPMQIMPGTLADLGVDGNGDGVINAHNFYDAVATALVHLCTRPGGNGLENTDQEYAAAVRYYGADIDGYASSIVAEANRIDAVLRSFAATQGGNGQAGGAVNGVVCPVPLSTADFIDSWGYPRSGGRTHKGTDVFSPRGTPVFAPQAGTVTGVKRQNTGLSGLSVTITTPGGQAWYMNHHDSIPGNITQGMQVNAGQVVAYIGDSGNARGTPPHAHTEYWPSGRSGSAINPYPTLAAACGK